MGFLKKHSTLILGLVITLIFLWLFNKGILDALEVKYYDMRMKFRTSDETANQIALVYIDDDSINELGRWPWPRSLIAEGIRKINAFEPKVIGFSSIFSEPQKDAGFDEIKNLEQLFLENLTDKQKEEKWAESLLQAMGDAQVRLDNDKKLADALSESGKVVLPVSLGYNPDFADIVEQVDPEDPLFNQSITVNDPQSFFCPPANDILQPIAPLFNTCAGIGHITLMPDSEDGVYRRETLLYKYRDRYVPSLTLKIVSLYKNIPLENIQPVSENLLRFGSMEIPTNYSELLVNLKGEANSFTSFSFSDIINDKIKNPSVFKNKIVLMGPSAKGLANPINTPTGSMPLGEFPAHVIWSILNKQFIQEPAWCAFAEFMMILFIGLLITFLLPRLKALYAGITLVVLVILFLGVSSYMFISDGLWVKVTYPLLELILGYIGIVSIQYLVTETGKEKVEGESAETNRMLGVSFQEQGMLDMAFDKFRKVPVDEQMKGILYNLGLDYERKRQYNKAAAVYEHIEEHDTKYKDVTTRKQKLMQASETMVFGDGFLTGSASDDPLMATGTDTRPTLGRYEIVKQLGKGAMGIVYLGQDPRINRTTAIKTIRFTDDFEEEEAEKMKEKFFREAESAGTLSHPNIVTIYDAGDENDLAYIAMEFLEGDDLEKYIKKENLLPMRKVIDYIADVADGLDYAHGRGIVHRDIKPANIMLIKGDVIKITDFGIARITSSSQTKTGVVKGTPFYMSPEQISGQKVDGRSDIFSLGVMLFQMVTGQVPFKGDSPAALMHQILNIPHPDPKSINPKIYKPLVDIINKSLEKDREKRYQKAIDMAMHLRELCKKIDAAKTKKDTG